MTEKEMSLVWGMVKMGGLKVTEEEGSIVCDYVEGSGSGVRQT